MAQGRKYAALPDLDSAPDIYETSEAADDTKKGAAPLSRASSASSASFKDATSASNSDAENENGTSRPSRVDRHSNRPARARDAFSGSRVDARGVNFSDRITDGRRSYRVPLSRKSRRRRREREGGGYVDEYGDFSDEDEEETFAEKLARLKREVEEMRVEGDRIAKEEDDDKLASGKRKEHKETQDGIAELGNFLNALQSNSRPSRLQTPALTASAPHQRRDGAAKNEATIGTVHKGDKSAPSEPQLPNSQDIERILHKAAEFESRLNLLEISLGANNPSVDVGPQTGQTLDKNVLTTLSTLESQFVALSKTTLPSIDSMDRQIRQLADDAARLEEARTAARMAQDNLAARSPTLQIRPGGSNGIEASPTSAEFPLLPEDADLASRIRALYNALPTIEAMSPLVPSVLERLKSLRVLHADAAAARENLMELEMTQARLEDEIKAWRDGLDKAEEAFRDSGETASRNATTVEAWVQDLEKRLLAFGA